MWQPGAQLIHQGERDVIVLNGNMDMQAKDQYGSCDILKFFQQFVIARIRCGELVHPDATGIRPSTDQR